MAQAILYSSGVGYFQREGTVEGNARIDLTFPAQDVNDLLKSLVLQDLGGGHIAAVSYDSQAPIEKTLQSFAVNLTGNPGFGQVLGQARGEKVEVALQQGNADVRRPKIDSDEGQGGPRRLGFACWLWRRSPPPGTPAPLRTTCTSRRPG